MTDMQKSVGFRGKAGDDKIVFAALQIRIYDIADKIGDGSPFFIFSDGCFWFFHCLYLSLFQYNVIISQGAFLVKAN